MTDYYFFFRIKETGKHYNFSYNIDENGNNYGHSEMSDGNVVKGRYFVQLPDGRLQIVSQNILNESRLKKTNFHIRYFETG